MAALAAAHLHHGRRRRRRSGIRDFLASEPKLTTEPKQVVTYKINPKAIWYDGTPITWQDFDWQWKALNGTSKAYQIASANGYEDIENVQRGTTTARSWSRSRTPMRTGSRSSTRSSRLDDQPRSSSTRAGENVR